MYNKDFNVYGLSKETLEALEKLGYEEPTEVQEQILPYAIHGRDLIVKAETGSGKTAAFVIPICERIVLEQKKPQVLVLAPTRELAVQIQEEFSNIGRLHRIRVAAIYGQQPMYIQRNQLNQRVHAIVATPGRLLDHMQRGNVSLDEIRYLVLDEADEMLNMGFIDQVETILNAIPPQRVTMLFSATMPEAIGQICNQYMCNPKKIEVASQSPTTERIKQFYYAVEEPEKFDLLNRILYTRRSELSIVFCDTREKVEHLVGQMKRAGYRCKGLHGGMEQRDRLAAMQRFKCGEFPLLITTDVAAKGIDIEALNLVINYDIPFDKEKYVHRIGRTGRLDNAGTAITFVTNKEVKALQEIEAYIGYQIAEQEPPIYEDPPPLLTNQLIVRPTSRRDRRIELNKEFTKIRINAGKKKNMRPGDILGALTNIEGISACDIGIIDVQDHNSYVDILVNKGSLVIEALQDIPIKGRKVKVKRFD